MSEPKLKPIYAAVPARTMGDENLSGLDLRVLMAIAAHDRLGANGIGCYASHTRLAGLVGCHLKSLSRSLRNLGVGGYISGNPHPLNGKLRVYRVRYTEFDAAYLKSIGNPPVTYEEATGNGLVPISAAIGNQHFGNIEPIQGDAEVNILGETLIHPGEPVLIHPGEPASIARSEKKGALEEGESRGVGAMLAMLERRMKDGKYDPDFWLRYLEKLLDGPDRLDIEDPNYHRAQRLFENIDYEHAA